MTSRNCVDGWEAFVRGAILWTGLFPLVIGCGSSADFPTGRVHGRVTHEGVPVQEGVVSVYSAELGIGASADLAEDGTYTIVEPLRTGKYTVAVLPPESPPEDSIPVAAKEYANIPQKYRDPRKSGLLLEISEGDRSFDVNMTR